MTKLNKDNYKVDFPKGNYFEENKEEMKSQLDFAGQNRFFSEIVISEKLYRNSWIFPNTPRNNFYFNYNENSYSIWNQEILPLDEEFLYFIKQHKTVTLKSYQYKMLQHMITHKRCICAAKMRSGKTLPTILLLSYLNKYSIFITTKNAKYGIENEFRKWKIRRPIDLTIETYDWFTDHYSKDLGLPEFLVFDEAQKLKNDSQRTRKAFSIEEERRSALNTLYTIMLSGSPAPNHQDDWWWLTEIIQPGFLAENSKTRLMMTLANTTTIENNYGGKYIRPVSWKKEEIHILASERLKGLVEVYNPESYGEAPIPIEKVLFSIPMEPKHKLVLNSLPTLVENKAALRMLYRKISDGISPEGEFFETAKDKQLVKLIQENEEIGRLVIYAYFKLSLNKLEKILISQGWDILRIDGENRKSINTSKSPDYLLAQMDASNEQDDSLKLCALIQADICEGLELSSTKDLIYYSRSENPGSSIQGEARIQSMNQKYSGARIIDLCYTDLDYRILEVIRNKMALSTNTLDIIELIQSEENQERIKERLLSIKDTIVYEYQDDENDLGIFNEVNKEEEEEEFYEDD